MIPVVTHLSGSPNCFRLQINNKQAEIGIIFDTYCAYYQYHHPPHSAISKISLESCSLKSVLCDDRWPTYCAFTQ